MTQVFIRVFNQIVFMGLAMGGILWWLVEHMFLPPIPYGAYVFVLVMTGIMTLFYALIVMLLEAPTWRY